MIPLHSTASRALALVFVLAGALAACSSQPPASGTSMGASGSTSAASPSGATPQQVNMCNVMRDYALHSQAHGGQLHEQCERQLGKDLCARCMESGL